MYNTMTGAVYTIYTALLKQKHLLIAGATGSGKSTLVNALIHTALYNGPNRVQFILIDCKGVELSDYAQLPHTIAHAITPQDSIKMLRYAVDIMLARFNWMRSASLKDYSGSDIYIIIDELADLMTTSKKEVVPLIQRLTQLGRAAHIHVIACTQCPLREIIPTTIKCNFDSRIALRTASRRDSQNVLDIAGAETLPDPITAGRAEMLYKHSTQIERYTVPTYSETERRSMIDFWLYS